MYVKAYTMNGGTPIVSAYATNENEANDFGSVDESKGFIIMVRNLHDRVFKHAVLTIVKGKVQPTEEEKTIA